MILTLQHTCERKNEFQILQDKFPIAFSQFNPNIKTTEHNPLLGSGYYFWDTNLDQAREWGRVHYKGDYNIFEANLVLDDNILDLAGNRTHMQYLTNLMATFIADDYGYTAWNLNEFIEFIRKISEEEEEYANLFPFKGIRATDNCHNHKYNFQRIYFDKTFPTFTNLNPYFIVCIFDKMPNLLTNFHLKETKNGYFR